MYQSQRLFWLTVFISSLIFGCASAAKKNQIYVGNQYAKDGLLREAADTYKKVLSQSPNNATAHRNLGMVLVKIGDYKGAANHLEKSMRRYEMDFDANFYLGEAYRAQDKYAEAIFRYKKSLKIQENDPRALKPLAWSYFKIRYYSEALTIARQLQRIASEDDQSAIILARTLLKLKRPKEALATLRAAKKSIERSSRPFYNSVEGDILYDQGNTVAAETAYREALKEQPLLAGALLGLGRCTLEQGKSKLAINYLERAVRIRPRLTEAHYLLGKAYENTDKLKALKYYQYFRKQAANDPEFISYLGDVKQRMSSLQQATMPKGLGAQETKL